MPNTPILPLELVALILDQLVGDQETLRQCSLACQAWKHLSQSTLFKSAHLRVNVNNQSHMLDFPVHLRPMINTISSVVVFNTSLTVLTLFPNVHTLHVQITSRIYQSSKWLYEHPKYILQLSLLRTISLAGLVLLPDQTEPFLELLLTSTPNLRSIEFIDFTDYYIYFKPPTAMIGRAASENICSLAILPDPQLFRNQDTLRWLFSLFSFASLTDLCIAHAQSYLHKVVGSIPNLERLIITSYKDDKSPQPIDLSHTNKSLLSITFKFYPYFPFDRHDPDPHIPPWLKETLATIPAKNIIAQIQFTTFITSPPRLDPDFFVRWVKIWSRLGKRLSPSRFPHLKRINLAVFGHRIYWRDSSYWTMAQTVHEMRIAMMNSYEEGETPFRIETCSGPLDNP